MKKVLIVEDDANIARALAIRVKSCGYEPIVAEEALTGVSLASEHRPDLILLDIMMPLGGGFSVIERLQNIAATADQRFIVITASKRPGLKDKADALGADGYFEKPYDPEELVEAIRNILGGSGDTATKAA
jgi:DNA-binding response OmpR family regulator